MGWFEAVVLGVVQGLTEFLPISSNAHLRIVGAAFGWQRPGRGVHRDHPDRHRARRPRLLRAGHRAGSSSPGCARCSTASARSDPDARMGWLIIVGSIPIIILGLLFQNQIETTLRDLRIIAIALVVFSLILYVADRRGRQGARARATSRSGTASSIGLAQSLALIPGVSRSGRHDHRRALPRATRGRRPPGTRSCWRSPPSSARGSTRPTRRSRAASHGAQVDWPPTILATVLAFVVGLAVIAWLLRYLARGSFMPFVVYRIVLGLLVLALVGAGVLDPNPAAAIASPPGPAAIGFAAVTTVVLLRHGRTTANAGGVLAGWTPGVQLDDAGQRAGAGGGGAAGEGAAGRDREQPARALPADRRRGRRRAASSTVQTDDRLGEARYGDWTGRDHQGAGQGTAVEGRPAAPVGRRLPGAGGRGAGADAGARGRRRPGRGTPSSAPTRSGWPAATAT